MVNRRNLISMIVLVGFGVLLNGLYFAGMADEFWSGLGTAFMFAAAVRLVRLIKYKNNPQYRENFDVEVNDERNKYISTKAWAWAGYLFVLISAIVGIVLRVMGENELSGFASMWTCLMLVLYWVSYIILKRKY